MADGDAPRLPQELIDMIIDNLCSDRAALKQCSLVCGNWLPQSSRYLLRRVYWPPRAYKDTACSKLENALVLEPSLRCSPCDCPTTAESSFETCIRILSSSFRLRSSIRELELTSRRIRCGKIPGSSISQVLDLLTIVTIMNHLPHLEILRINHGALRSQSLPRSPVDSYKLKKLHLKDLTSNGGIISILELLSLSRCTIHRFSIGCSQGGWFADVDFSARHSDLAALDIEALEFPTRNQLYESSHAPCRDIIARTNMASLRHVACYELTPQLLMLIRATPNLESLIFIIARNNRIFAIPPGALPQSLASVTFRMYLALDTSNAVVGMDPAVRAGNGDLCSWMFMHVGVTLATLGSLNLREVVISFRPSLDKRGAEALGGRGVYPTFESALSGDWQYFAVVLGFFESLRAVVVEVDFSCCEAESLLLFQQEPGRCATIARNVATHHLPSQFVDILQVREVQ